jgi:hypothetical protein
MADQKTIAVYDPEKVQLQLDGVYITGYSEESKITVEKNQDNFLPAVGVDGIVSVAINYDATAKMSIKLASTSASVMHIRQLAKGRRLFNMTLTDLNANGENKSCDGCFILKTPPIKRNKKVEDEEFDIYIPYFEEVKDLNGGDYNI